MLVVDSICDCSEPICGRFALLGSALPIALSNLKGVLLWIAEMAMSLSNWGRVAHRTGNPGPFQFRVKRRIEVVADCLNQRSATKIMFADHTLRRRRVFALGCPCEPKSSSHPTAASERLLRRAQGCLSCSGTPSTLTAVASVRTKTMRQVCVALGLRQRCIVPR